MFKYPARFVIDLLFLAVMLTIPACMFCRYQEPSPPQVDMSQATLVWEGHVE